MFAAFAHAASLSHRARQVTAAAPPPRDRSTGRFDLIATVPDTPLGGDSSDTTDLRVLGAPLKLIGIRTPGTATEETHPIPAAQECSTS